jgi:anti-sigma B factor antagonist
MRVSLPGRIGRFTCRVSRFERQRALSGPPVQVSYPQEVAAVFEVEAEPGPDGVTVIRVAGEVDLTVSAMLERELVSAPTADGVRGVVVDLGGLRFLDSSGVHALVKGYLASRGAGLVYTVRNATGVVARVLRITGVAEAFGITDAGELSKGA